MVKLKVLMETLLVFFFLTSLSTVLRGIQSLCFHSLLSSLLAWDIWEYPGNLWSDWDKAALWTWICHSLITDFNICQAIECVFFLYAGPFGDTNKDRCFPVQNKWFLNSLYLLLFGSVSCFLLLCFFMKFTLYQEFLH